MFAGCKLLTEIDLSKFNTGRVENMKSMFFGCNLLNKLDMSHLYTSNVTNMMFMFYECSSLPDSCFMNVHHYPN